MKILKKNMKEGEVTINITATEDLWYLSHIVEIGDIISGSTERKIKIGSDERAKAVRKRVFLKIKTEKTEYTPETNSLRILGKITEGPEDVPLGDHHSFNLEINDKITIKKPEWTYYELEKLEQSTKQKNKIIIVVFDREEATFATLTNTGYDILTKIKGDIQKKQHEEQHKGEFYKEIKNQLQDYVTRLDIKQIIIASPAFWKEYLIKELPEPLKKITTQVTVSSGDESSLQEIMKHTELKKILENEATAKEMQAIEEILEAIRKDKACYGYTDSKNKTESGQTKKILVSENLLKEMKQKGTYKEIDALLRNAEALRTEIIILSGKESQKKLDGLGGIAGLLRW